jgi:hypothetical protein
MEQIDISHLPIELYGFCGKMGSCKDYIVKNHFLPYLDLQKTHILAFADHLKVDVASKYSLDLNTLYTKKTNNTRMLLQRVGTEEGRDVFGEFLWINAVGNWIKLLYTHGVTRFIITDCRFINEVNWITNNGGSIIYISAKDRNFNRLWFESNGDNAILKQLQTHSSETELDNVNFDNVINNSIDNEWNIEDDIKKLIIKL